MITNFLFEFETSDTAKPVARIIFDGFTQQEHKTWHHLIPFSCAFTVHARCLATGTCWLMLVVNCNDLPFMTLSLSFWRLTCIVAVANAGCCQGCSVSWCVMDSLDLVIFSDSLPFTPVHSHLQLQHQGHMPNPRILDHVGYPTCSGCFSLCNSITIYFVLKIFS